MKQTIYYTYLGDKGTITTQLQIVGAIGVKKILLVAEDNKQLTKDNKHFYKTFLIPEAELSQWHEVPVTIK